MLDFRMYVGRRSAIDDNGFISVQYDAFGESEAGVPEVQQRHSYGFRSRMVDPSLTSQKEISFGCDMLLIDSGSYEEAFLLDDSRVTTKLPVEQPGGSTWYGSDGEAGHEIFGQIRPTDKQLLFYVPYADDKAHLVTYGLDAGGTPILELAHGEGMSITMLDDTITISNRTGTAYAKLTDDGWEFIGPVKIASGLDVGGAAARNLAHADEIVLWSAAVATALQSIVPGFQPIPPTVIALFTKGA